MKPIITVLLVVMSTQLLSAQKCKYTSNKKDPFTGEQIVTAVHTNRGWTWASIRQGDKFLIEMTFLHAGDIQKPMTVNDSVLVKLADGSVFHFRPMADVQPVSQSKSYTSGTSTTSRSGTAVTTTMELTSFSPRFLVDKSVVEKMSQSGLVAIRLDFTGKPVDFDFQVKPLIKSVEPIMNQSKCILAIQ